METFETFEGNKGGQYWCRAGEQKGTRRNEVEKKQLEEMWKQR